MESARTLEVAPGPAPDESPLARARLHRQLTVDERKFKAIVANSMNDFKLTQQGEKVIDMLSTYNPASIASPAA